MRDPKEIQAELDTAQANLTADIAELKQVIEEKIEEKLETPRHVIEVVEIPISFIRKHAMLIGVLGVFSIGVLLGRHHAHR